MFRLWDGILEDHPQWANKWINNYGVCKVVPDKASWSANCNKRLFNPWKILQEEAPLIAHLPQGNSTYDTVTHPFSDQHRSHNGQQEFGLYWQIYDEED